MAPPLSGHSGHGLHHEKRAEWREIDAFAFSRLHPASRPGVQALEETAKRTEDAGMPKGYVSPMFGKFLSVQARLMKAKHVLEVGTLGGYSAIWMASEVPELHVTSIEYNPKHAEVARKNIQQAGVSERVTVLDGAGLDVLPKLLKEIEDGKREKFGMTFIDADEMNSYAYCDFAIQMSYPGACIIIDNVMGRAGSRVDDPNATDEHAVAGRKVIEECGKDTRIDGVVMQFVGARMYDGYYLGTVL